MSWVTVGVAVATTAYGAYSQNKAQKDAQSLQNQAMAAAGQRPDIAEYEAVDLAPVDYQQIQGDTLNGNINFHDLIRQLMAGNSQINQETSRNRAGGFSDSLWNNVGATSDIASGYLAGKPSWSDAMETVARSTGLTGSVGTPGTGAALTARDLGLMDMDLRQRGSALNAQAISQAEALDPRGNYGTPQDWQLTPRETVPWKINENLQLSEMAIKQAENQYTAEQSGYNIAAGLDPRAVAGLAYQGQANQGVDWGKIIQGLGTAYSTYKGNSTASTGLNTGGTYNSAASASKAAPYAAGTSGSASAGYVPKAAVVS